MAIPVDLYTNWWEYEFSGVQVYHISPQEGITLRGQISTQPDAAVDYPSYWGWTRGLFIEDSIYAVTEVGVDAALTTSPSNVINSIELQGSSNIGGGGIIGVVVDPAVDVGIDAPVDEQTGGVSGGGDAAP